MNNAIDDLVKAQAAYIVELEGQVKEVEGELTVANKRIKSLKAQLNAAHEALLGSGCSLEFKTHEIVMAYNGRLVLDEEEMTVDEMKAYMADKVRIPITREA